MNTLTKDLMLEVLVMGIDWFGNPCAKECSVKNGFDFTTDGDFRKVRHVTLIYVIGEEDEGECHVTRKYYAGDLFDSVMETLPTDYDWLEESGLDIGDYVL